jgi:hypothetical protein
LKLYKLFYFIVIKLPIKTLDFILKGKKIRHSAYMLNALFQNLNLSSYYSEPKDETALKGYEKRNRV